MTHRNSHRIATRFASFALVGGNVRLSGLVLGLVLVLLITTGGAG